MVTYDADLSGRRPTFLFGSVMHVADPFLSDRSQGFGGRDPRQIVDRVRSIATPIVRALSLDLVDVEYAGQGPRTVLRVFIDKPGGVSVRDCEQVHLSLGHALDVADPIPHTYILEVSSPGLDRPLRRREDYERALGKLVTLKFRNPRDGQWRLAGRLQLVGATGVTLNVKSPRPGADEQATLIEWEAIAEGRLLVEL
jgi:ribosome maturation factor RimP